MSIEIPRPIRRQSSEVRRCGVIAREKLLFYLDEVAKGDAAAEGGGGGDEVGQAAGGRVAVGVVRGRICDIVDEVLVVRVVELLGFVVVNFGEDEGGEGGGLGGGGGGVFGEDGGAVGDAGASIRLGTDQR